MAQYYQQPYGGNPWGAPQHGAPQPGVFIPQQPAGPDAFAAQPLGGSVDPFLSGVAGDVLRQQGQTYLQRSQAFMQSKMGFLSGGVVQYLFDVTPDYVASKLAMLLLPFLRKWSYSRMLEQLTGGHKYVPARQDVNAPDLYIPIMALWTYCILVGVALFGGQAFRPEAVYNTVSTAIGAWAVHTMLLKLLVWILGISSAAPLLELAAYAGYPFVAACGVLAARLTLGGGPGYHGIWAYFSFAMATFLVRTMKRVIFHEAQQYGHQTVRHNYLLLGLAIFQFPYLAWLSRVPV